MIRQLIRSCSGAVAVAVVSLGHPVAHGAEAEQPTVERTRRDWTPGTADMIPQDVLTLYPCHSAELACAKIPPPAVERVSFEGPVDGDAQRGERIATNVRYGNCIACHMLPGHQGGTVGPSLAEYGDRQVPLEYVYQRIWDTRLYNPDAFMPLYGTNKVLTDQEIRDVMAFIGLR